MGDSSGSWLLDVVLGFFLVVGVALAFTRGFIDELTTRTKDRPHFRWLVALFGVGALVAAVVEKSWLWRMALVGCGIAYSYIAWRLFQKARADE